MFKEFVFLVLLCNIFMDKVLVEYEIAIKITLLYRRQHKIIQIRFHQSADIPEH